MKKGKISSRDVQLLLTFAIIVTIITSSLAYVYLYPPPQEEFLTSWILDSQGLAQHYYPRDNPNIRLGEEVNWTLGVYNHMGSLEYVAIRVKLLNSTLPSPNDTLGEPSPAPVILEFAQVLLNNQTWSIPFDWEISNFTIRGGNTIITGLLVNQNLLQGQFASANLGQGFRFVFEVWFYDIRTNNLAFSFSTNGRPIDSWTQVWFNVGQG